ncbi:porin [Paracoccus sp. Z118]|uniref:porin n=1 Tax=Paracoccus sp. Z118 TaxID=2851017 RepID=UPI001C2CAC64|nr:porin [Paracoccus sp. Z118]MBV0891217.1 porin [Paracoccus sp. Z118]
MKKLLIATTALVMTTGVAAAEITLSGDARMGMIYDGEDVQFGSRVRLKFNMTGESDTGLSYGASFRVDQEDFNNTYRSAAFGNRGVVWISGTYGKLSMGDPVGAAEAVHGDLFAVGYTDGAVAFDPEEFNYLVGDGANRNQGPTVLYEYTMNQLSFFASATDGVARDWGDVTRGDFDDFDFDDGDDIDAAWSLGVKYDGDQFFGGLSYSDSDIGEEIGASIGGSWNQLSGKLVYLDYDIDEVAGTGARDKSYGIDVVYEMDDAWTIGGFWRRDEWTADVVALNNTGDEFDMFGIGAQYNLGGGVTLAGGIIDSDYVDDTVADLGVKFTF